MTTSSRSGGAAAAIAGLLLLAAPVLAGPAPDAREIASGLAALGPRADPVVRGRAVSFLLDALRRAGIAEARAVPASGGGGFVNVEGVVPGASPEEIVLSAHYDSVPGSPGAGDDGSGCGVALAAAADLRRTPLRHTVRVVLFDGEEAGSRGSEAWLRDRGAGAERRILAGLNLEMLGWGGSAGPVIHLFPARTLRGPGRAGERVMPPGWLVHAVQRSGDAVSWPYAVADDRHSLLAQLVLRAVDVRLGADSDVFLRRGIPAVTLSDSGLLDLDPAYHRPADVAGRLDAHRLERWTEATSAAVRRLDALAARPLFEDQYLDAFGRVWLRRDLIWIGFLLWALLVLRGRPGRWRGASAEERRRQMGSYLPGFLFRVLLMLAIFLAPVFAVLLWPSALLALAPPRTPGWRAVWIVLGGLPFLILLVALGVATSQGLVITAHGFRGGAAAAALIPAALVTYVVSVARPRRSLAITLVLLTFTLASCGRQPGSETSHPEKWTNRLVHESSPYLLLHAHNPVDWYPWGEEAFAMARREDKPIFLSVGYSSCYWCHIMEREVFSRKPIADLMNRWFVNVKVDREERPDLDEIYIDAAEILTGGGGWPNSIFLTPDLEPFFAGSYFPPEDREGQPGFPKVLRELHDSWAKRRPEVNAAAARVAAALRQTLAARSEPSAEIPSKESARRAVVSLESHFDARNGGFDGPPKFPSPASLLLLWEADAEGRRMVLVTLKKMGQGAIYDQLGGGFHRYTLDAQWRVPHFEKMLYDNAHLAELLAVAWQAEKDPELARLARGTLDFVLAEMTLPEGGFKSAIDAEVQGQEGAGYTWTRQELESVLGPEGFKLLAPTFGFDGQPNLPGGRYTLYLPKSLSERAAELGISREELLARLSPYLDKLRAARRQRQPPRVDDKALADWNGMTIAALARAGKLLGEPRYLAAAGRGADFVLARFRAKDGTLLHAWRRGEAKIPAFLDDYAFLIRGLLALHEATGQPRWLAEAERLAGEMESRLRDPRGGYYLTAPRPHLLFQPKTVSDRAIPSGNGVAMLDLLALAERTGKPEFRQRAEQAARAFADDLAQYPENVQTLALGVLRLHGTAVAG
ncbi:MAG: DUF255 domain-containing protein [Acidobacteria bacterium]|nr:DUF255 domain-containing protein [Acidobacteriota bacterium]